MKYILALIIGVVTLFSPGVIANAEISDPLFAQRAKGIYLNVSNVKDTDKLVAAMEHVKRVGLTTIVFDVKEHFVYFNSQEGGIAKDAGVVLSLYDLPQLVAEAKKHGMYTIARYVAVKDKALGDALPETRIKHPITRESLDSEWVEPSDETVLEYNRELIIEVAKAGVDEINLDYIRYPTDNISALSNMTLNEKVVHLEEFVRMARRAIDSVGYDTKLGISTYAIIGWYYESSLVNTAQDVKRFAPFVDVISPMAYPATFAEGAYFDPSLHPRSRMYYLVYRTLEGYKEILGEEHAWKLRPWIQGYFTTPNDIIDEMDAVYAADLCGFTVWSQGNYYGSLYAGYAQWKTPIPEHCTVQNIADSA
ncbi:hypothetical protein COU75_02770 [Candidatus Peregrinibacteria bacterium CG10_big_fil_rev_8_21_14_0_10_42_8]|nr:MAG: hypothetical protein COU75_02770 [Candidatus Peregrinibacteria bacterium CG10_big_fil_rev_8_21_14_0_10_42_8]